MSPGGDGGYSFEGSVKNPIWITLLAPRSAYTRKNVENSIENRHICETCRCNRHEASICRQDWIRSTRPADLSIRSTQPAFVSTEAWEFDVCVERVDGIDRTGKCVEKGTMDRHILETCRLFRQIRTTCRNSYEISTGNENVSIETTRREETSIGTTQIDSSNRLRKYFQELR